MPARTPDYVQWIGSDRVLRMPLKSTGSEQNWVICGELGVYTVISISKAVGNLGEFLVVAEGWTDVWVVCE